MGEARRRSEHKKMEARFAEDAKPKNPRNAKYIVEARVFRTSDIAQAMLPHNWARASDDTIRLVNAMNDWRKMQAAKPLHEKPLCLLCNYAFISGAPAMFVRVLGAGTTQPGTQILSGICHGCAASADLKERLRATIKEGLGMDNSFDLDEPAGSA